MRNPGSAEGTQKRCEGQPYSDKLRGDSLQGRCVPHKALIFSIFPSNTIPQLYMSPHTLHMTHCQLPILSAASPWRGKQEEQEEACSDDVRCQNSDGTRMQPVGSGGGEITAEIGVEDAHT